MLITDVLWRQMKQADIIIPTLNKYQMAFNLKGLLSIWKNLSLLVNPTSHQGYVVIFREI